MHRSIIVPVAAGLISLVFGSPLTEVHQLLRRRDCGNLTNVPLSPDPNHSTYTIVLDPSVESFINSTSTALNTIEVTQWCDKPNVAGHLSWNYGYAKINKFGAQNPYTITTDRCERWHSRTPMYYYVRICGGDGLSCDIDSLAPRTKGGLRDNGVKGRFVCPVDDGEGSPKAIALNDPLPWIFKVCTTKHCAW
ncbi:hypothetical protein LX32DRAFT_675648 [Colletotrichum zoysiae]|uniref:Uncharacterized protein n=1 Tax=Colletotrichum zoysiae TaxID=1216348 RepID=A0AAD9LWN1_9PEZI|nr:hypothetical protein LX32DRAFT_675648 [Colletotrichum zoysiae]